MDDLADKVNKARQTYNQLALDTLKRLERVKQSSKDLAQAATTKEETRKKKKG